MKPNYTSEKFEFWTKTDLIVFNRKLEHETAFDGLIKIYSLKTNHKTLNRNLKGKYFGGYIHYAHNGIFLRMFKSKHSWPNTQLVFISFVDYKITTVKKTNSSWSEWTTTHLGEGRYSIEIAPNKEIECDISDFQEGRIYVDFNEMVEADLILLSKTDYKIDSNGQTTELTEGMTVKIYSDDLNSEDERDDLFAEGIVELNKIGGWTEVTKWNCRINERGIYNQSDEYMG